MKEKYESDKKWSDNMSNDFFEVDTDEFTEDVAPLDDDYTPVNYEPGPDDPGPVETDVLHGTEDTPEPLDGGYSGE